MDRVLRYGGPPWIFLSEVERPANLNFANLCERLPSPVAKTSTQAPTILASARLSVMMRIIEPLGIVGV